MKKTFLSLATLLTIIAFSGIAMAGPNDYHMKFNNPSYHMKFNNTGYNSMASHHPGPPPSHHHQPAPPPPSHHHHHHPAPMPYYYGYAPVIPMNQVISVNYPNASYYYSTPYYAYPYPTYSNYYYPNKTLTVRTKHVLFSI